MSADADELIIKKPLRDNFVEVVSDLVSGVKYKYYVLLFIIFLFLSSDIFVNRMLSRLDGAVEYKTPTSYGTGLQGMFLVMGGIIVDLLTSQGVL